MKYLIGLLALTFLGFAYPEKPTARVNDYTNTLSQEERVQLERSLYNIEQTQKAQVAIAIFENIEGEEINDFTNKLANKWKLGSKDRNDGLLLVLAMKERKMRIEVGYGLEGIIPDAMANRIIREDLRPNLKRGDLNGALTAYVEHVQTLLVPVEDTVTLVHSDDESSNWWLYLLLGVLPVGMGLFFFGNKKQEPVRRHSGTNATTIAELKAMLDDENKKSSKKAKKATKSTASTHTYVPVVDTTPRRSSSYSSSSDDSSYSSSSSSSWSSGGGSDDSGGGFSGGGGSFGGGGSDGSW